MDDLYKRLGISSNASPKEIRSAYRRRARSNHPDVSTSPDSAAEFAQISEAYRILSDPAKRAAYDRGETVVAQPFAFYSAQRQQAVAYQRKIDHIVDEMLEDDRRETETRGRVVTTLVTLFISTFVFALLKPVRFNPQDWPVAIVAGGLSLLGIWRLISVIRGALEHYTYRPPTPSVTHPTEPPSQPFTRAMALGFLTIGYIGSLAAGAILDEATGGAFSGGGFPRDAMMGALLYPPILVMIIDTLRKLGELMDGMTRPT